jgi:hypothetical protein
VLAHYQLNTINVSKVLAEIIGKFTVNNMQNAANVFTAKVCFSLVDSLNAVAELTSTLSVYMANKSGIS